MAQEKADAAVEAELPKKSGRKWLIIVGTLLLAVGGAGAWYFLGQQPSGPAKVKQEPPKPPIFVSLDTFTVNLQADPAEQFLQVDLTLQLADEAEANIVKQHMPEVRNRLLMLLTSKRGSEIATIEGKKKLSQEIAAQLKDAFAAGAKLQHVPGVFFTSFVIQ
jgi:flagellar FliL protein